MSESFAISSSNKPNTVQSLEADFLELGLERGMTVIVHSSLRSIGWVCGGPIAVIQALLNVLTSEGTLVMPSHSSGNTDPAKWQNPPVPESWWEIIRDTMPAFDPRITPTSSMGAISEAFRSFPSVLRSYHPAVSFSAFGKHADRIISNHSLVFSLGESSPLAEIYNLDGFVLLLGVGHCSNTSLHLAESRLPNMPLKNEGGSIAINGKRAWKTYQDFDYDSSDFENIGQAFESANSFFKNKVGNADARMFKQKSLVDFAVTWISKNRK